MLLDEFRAAKIGKMTIDKLPTPKKTALPTEKPAAEKATAENTPDQQNIPQKEEA